MPSLPVVSIVGRPNVGKSSLFNRILGRKAAVVDDVSGVTRDRNSMNANWGDCRFTLVDTGGLEPTSRESIVCEIHTQVNIAIEESSAIVFMVECGTGTTDLDMLISRDLLKRGCDNVILAVNKSESESAQYEAATFASSGLGEPMPISALHGQGIGDLLDRICATIKSRPVAPAQSTGPTEDICIAVIGRPNAGKSSFVNCVLKQNRMIVDSKPGTTRDAIDTVFNYKKRSIRLVDTAGLRRKSQVKENLEYYSNLRALSSMRRADICLLMIDTTVDMASQNLKILAQLNDMKKGLVVCFNKWDIMDKDHKTFDNLVSEMRRNYMELRHAPFVSTSALTGQRVNAALDAALKVHDRMANVVQPARLRQAVFDWVLAHPHPYASNKEVRFLGVRQRKGPVPNFEFFCTNPDCIVPSYERYLTNKIYTAYDFDGCPVILAFRKPGRAQFKPKTYTPDMGEVY